MFNSNNSSMLYKFDAHLKQKNINWSQLPFEEKAILNYFKEKFSSRTTSTSFQPGPSSIKKGPKNFTIYRFRNE